VTSICYLPGPCECKLCGAAPVPRNEPGAATVQSKLAAHDEFAPAAVRYVIDWLREDPEPLLAMARGRHAEGHYRYGDSLMFEYSQDELVAEAAQELADAICYLSLLLRRSASPGS
jgi:hypothetical protein